MTQYYLVGIGGTGAKCVEAALHLFAAGLGPESVNVCFIDADIGNGNLARAEETRQRYEAAYDALHAEDGRLSGACRLLATKVSPLGDNPVWSPAPSGENGDTLQTLFKRSLMPGDDGALFDALFQSRSGNGCPGEQGMSLKEGFRGRPSVGAAVIQAMANSGNATWQALEKAVARGKSEPVRIFLFGSIFGGTGAAGFPVVARLLRQVQKREEMTAGVEISGALLLPYFRFQHPPTEGGRIIAADPDLFIEQTRGALDYYYRLSRQEDVLDSLYLVGWPNLIEVPQTATGGKWQRNPPLLPELYAALAAVRFFRNGAGKNEKVLHIACNGDAGDAGDAGGKPVLGWSDLPGINSEEPVKPALARLIRFSLALRNIYGPLLTPAAAKLIHNQYWYHRLITEAGVVVSGDAYQAKLKSVSAFCEQSLRWVASLQNVSISDALDVALVDSSTFAKGKLDDNGLAPLSDPWDERGRRGFAAVIRDSAPTGLHTLFEALTEKDMPESYGAARFFEMLFRHSALEQPVARRKRA
jgi:hypothetical protein